MNDATELDDELRYALEYNPQQKGYGDLVRILAKHEGENDGEDWAWLVEFKDGTRGMYVGGCDYTGWDCQSSLQLLPFEGWEARLTEEWGTYHPTSAAAVVSELRAQLESRP